MPDAGPWRSVTRTDDLAHPLEGRRAARLAPEDRRERRRHAVRRHSGALDGVFPPDALDELRNDWPS